MHDHSKQIWKLKVWNKKLNISEPCLIELAQDKNKPALLRTSSKDLLAKSKEATMVEMWVLALYLKMTTRYTVKVGWQFQRRHVSTVADMIR